MKKNLIFGVFVIMLYTLFNFSYGINNNNIYTEQSVKYNVANKQAIIPFSSHSINKTDAILADDPEDVITIKVKGNDREDECYVLYKADASDDYDFDYDAVKFPGVYEAPQIYTEKTTSDGWVMQLTAQGLNNINKINGLIVYLSVGLEMECTISIKHTMVQSFSPVLRDRLLDVIINPGDNYVFTASPNDDKDRFEIIDAQGGNCDASITTTEVNYCTNHGVVQFTAVDGGGTWSGEGISANGLFNPATATTGTHTITYTIPGACNTQDQITINVFQAPSVNLGKDLEFCEGESNILDAGEGFASYEWNPTGNTQIITVTTAGTYSVTVTDDNNCQANASVKVTFIPKADATITTSKLTYCQNESPVLFTTKQSDGTWSGSGINFVGLFSPESAGPGTHTITYTIPGNCGDSKSVEVTVYSAPTINLGSDQTICEGEEVILDAGKGHTTYAWSPSGDTQTKVVTQTGQYSVTVTSDNGCKDSDEIFITVMETADATITTTKLDYCSNDGPTLFTTLQAGGTWQGNGISKLGLFDPAIAGIGTHTITYSFLGNCGDSKSVEVTVNEAPSVYLGKDQTICEGEEIILDAGEGFDTYTWLPQGNEQTNTVTESGTYSVTVSLNNCYASDNITLTFTEAADASITTTDLTYCSNDEPIQLETVQSGGYWSGNGINETGVFNPAEANVGMHLITYTIEGNCGDQKSVAITVNEAFVDELIVNICKGEVYEFDEIEIYETGTYTIENQNIHGCDSIHIVHLFVDTIDVSVTQYFNVLTANNENASAYQWIDCNTQSEIEGATEQVFIAEEVGDYAVIVTEENCTDISECYPVITVGTSEITEDVSLQIFPNPVADKLFIKTNNHVSISIKNIIGSTLFSASYGIGTHQIDVSLLPNGIYFIESSNNSITKTTRKFIKH